MDWNLNSFEPNLKFALELKEDLKTKYYEQHERAKKALETFSVSLKNIYCEHQKLLTEKVELSITNERLQQIIDKHGCSKEKSTIDIKPYSEVLGASLNCRLEIPLKSSNKRTYAEMEENKLVTEKENINGMVPIYSADFLSDMEEDFAEKYKSPSVSVAGSPTKIQESPVLSKRKRSNNLKKSNSSISNSSSHSIASNSESSKSNTSHYATLEIIDIDKNLEKEFEKEIVQEPLKAIENSVQSQSNVSKVNENYKILNVSKTSYGNTDFIEKGKKLRQTKLTLTKPTPMIDLSKIDLNESFSGQNHNKSQSDNFWNETFFDGQSVSPNKNSNVQKIDNKVILRNLDTLKEDELIETSFASNKNISKLRHKLSLNKKSDIIKCKKKDKSYEKPQRTLSDETYFSQAERPTNKNDNHEIDSTELEDEICETPPAKRKLLNSFDIIPGRTQESPEFVYKEVGVRKKNERAQLAGWSCRDCEKWYRDMPEADRKNRINKCSRHRGKYKVDILTPESFWDPGFNSTDDSSVFEEK